MEIFYLCSFIVLVIASLGQTDSAGGHAEQKLVTKAAEAPIEVTKCPQNAAIFPCICGTYWYGFEIECSGPEVNQTSIENAFREARQANGIPEDRSAFIYRFLLQETNLTQLDLAPFYGNALYYVNFEANINLTKVVTSGRPEDHGSIQVERLRVQVSPIKRDGLGDMLQYFSNNMTEFIAYGLDLDDFDSSVDQGEILGGLSAHTNLNNLQFSGCNIAGPFNSSSWIPQGLQHLETISLEGNNITQIGEGVFDFDSTATVDGEGLAIALSVNKLNENSFHPNSGIARKGRRTTLILYFNEIRTLPAEIFETFLDAHPQNALYLWFNHIICDERLSWIKARRAEFESRVLDADCENDPGYNVFTSSLIP